jgi:hypothetical protein
MKITNSNDIKENANHPLGMIAYSVNFLQITSTNSKKNPIKLIVDVIFTISCLLDFLQISSFN